MTYAVLEPPTLLSALHIPPEALEANSLRLLRERQRKAQAPQQQEQTNDLEQQSDHSKAFSSDNDSHDVETTTPDRGQSVAEAGDRKVVRRDRITSPVEDRRVEGGWSIHVDSALVEREREMRGSWLLGLRSVISSLLEI
jgi:hypothetical protein